MGGGSKSFFTGVALCILFSLLSIFAVLYNGFPLGVAGEWSWPRVKNPEIPVMEIVSIAMLFAIAAATAFIIDFRSAAHRGGRITGIVIILLCGLCIDYQILLSGRAGVNENIVGIIDKYTSGYMTEAGKISSPVQYFTDFINPQNSRSTTPEHIDVHPPGDILASWLALKACGKSETLRKLIDMALPAGCIQEVAPEGDSVMAGYWRNPEATAAALREGWLFTGDVGCLDVDGFLTLKDRSKDLIISGGSNIYPREVEELLLTAPGVAEVAVVGAPDPEWGEFVVAFVVAQAGAALSADLLDQHCLAQMARFKRPKRYLFVSELPKNNYGKVLKTALRERLAAEQA